MIPFNYNIDFKSTDFRKSPELYQIGRGEQGVLLVEPYKSEILPYWKFKTPEIATKSAKNIYALFIKYKLAHDFVGMDMSRKFLQMGYTRSRRYANHASGRKYEKSPQKKSTEKAEKRARAKVRPQAEDWATNDKAQSAQIFYDAYLKAREDPTYKKMKAAHQNQ